MGSGWSGALLLSSYLQYIAYQAMWDRDWTQMVSTIMALGGFGLQARAERRRCLRVGGIHMGQGATLASGRAWMEVTLEALIASLPNAQ